MFRVMQRMLAVLCDLFGLIVLPYDVALLVSVKCLLIRSLKAAVLAIC